MPHNNPVQLGIAIIIIIAEILLGWIIIKLLVRDKYARNKAEK